MASRLRDLRAAAMTTGSERVATIDVNSRAVRFSDGRAPLELSHTIAIAVTGAESERSSAALSGVRFFPNGSSSGATIQFKSERQAYEVRDQLAYGPGLDRRARLTGSHPEPRAGSRCSRR